MSQADDVMKELIDRLKIMEENDYIREIFIRINGVRTIIRG
jgi:hypothetical protein